MTLWTIQTIPAWHEPHIAEPFVEKSIQATVWEITMGHVVACRRFTAR